MRTLPCGLPYDAFMDLVATTSLNRINQTEAQAIFEKLSELGFKVVPSKSK
jgi:hypothetical protein